MTIRPYEVTTEVFSDFCSSCGNNGRVFELQLRHGGEGNPMCIPLCKNCFKKIAEDINREWRRIESDAKESK